MKRVLFVFLIMLIVPPTIEAQQQQWENWFISMFQNQYDGIYKVDGCFWGIKKYDDLEKMTITLHYLDYNNESEHITLTIPESSIVIFDLEIRQIKGKYEEWEKVAKANNVQDYIKEIPVQITAVKEMSGNSLSYPTSKVMRPMFKVKNGEPTCYLEVSISGYGIMKRRDVYFKANQLNELCNEISKALENHYKKVNEKNRIDNLFR